MCTTVPPAKSIAIMPGKSTGKRVPPGRRGTGYRAGKIAPPSAGAVRSQGSRPNPARCALCQTKI